MGASTRARHLVVLALICACDSSHDKPADAGAADADSVDSSERLDAPINVVASDGTLVNSVNIAWDPVDGATSYRLWRDGAPIADVVDTAFDDTTAASPTSPSAPVLTATAGTYVDRVDLTWTPSSSAPGATHLYHVTALRDTVESVPSSSDSGYRGSHQVMTYEVSTDAGASFPIMTAQTMYSDTAAPAGVITSGTVTASDGASETHVAVSLGGASVAVGAQVSYVVRAVTTGGTQTSNVATGHRGVGALSFQWHRHVFPEGGISFRTPIVGVMATPFMDTDTAGARLHAYDCTLSASGVQSVTTKPDLGWRAARAAETPRTDTWVVKGSVHAVAAANDALYIGGNFDYVGPPTGAFAAVDATTGAASPPLARFQANHHQSWVGMVGVNTATQDGTGRWYVGGDFTAVSGVPQARLARLTPTGQLDRTFAPVVLNGTVDSIAIGADTLFIAGTFTSVDWQQRNGFAALDITNGALKPLAPLLYSPPSIPVFIRDVYVNGGVLFVSGSFTMIDGLPRTSLAAIDIASGAVTSWDSQANVTGISIRATSGNTLYVMGGFTQIGGQPRDGLAAIDTQTGLATAFTPGSINGYFGAVAVNATAVFVSGIWSVSNQNKRGVAVFDVNTGARLAVHSTEITPLIGGVSTLALNGNTLYLGGEFESIEGQPRKRLAALNATTGEVLSWAPVTTRNVNFITVRNNTVYVGGMFSSIGGKAQCCLAALDRATGSLLPWNPGVDGVVNTLALSGTSLFVGGAFANIGGQARKNLARLDRSTGAVMTWTADATGSVLDLAISGDTLYVAGFFSSIAGQSRSSLAAVDINTANLTAWDPNANSTVSRIVTNGSTVYVAAGPSSFTSVGGQQRNGLAALDATTGVATPWDPNPNGTVGAIAIAGNNLYVGGSFTTIGGQSRSKLASFDVSTGMLSSWSTAAFGDVVHGLGIAGNSLYASGYFGLGTRLADYVGAVDNTTGATLSWYPWWFGSVTRVVASGTSLIVAGGVRHIAGYPSEGIAIFDL